MNELRFYGVKEKHEVFSDIDQHAEEIAINGYTIIEGILNDQEVRDFRAKTDAIYQRQATEIGGEERLTAINDAYIGRSLLAYDESFLLLAQQPRIRELVEALLGDYFILGLQNAIINLPNQKNYQASWHRDLSYQHFVASRPIAVSALVCIDPFSEETGGTYVLPASHKTEKFPSERFIKSNEKSITAPAGAAIVFDSMLFHRAGYNRSQSIRRGINHMYVLPFIKQQISLPGLLGGRYEDDPFLKRFLGYESEPAASVIEWRTNKLERLNTR